MDEKKTTIRVWNATQTMSNSTYEINHYVDKNFQTVSMHSHDFFEVYFFIKGSASYIVENGHYTLKSGDVLLISPNNLHQLDIHNSSTTYERIVLWININYIKKLSSDSTDLAKIFYTFSSTSNHILRDNALSQNIHKLLIRLSEIENKDTYGVDIEKECLLTEILLLLNRSAITKTENVIQKMPPLINKAIEIINSNLTEKLSLDILAEKLFVNKYYLSHVFKNATNTSIHRFIYIKRLILSKQLIEKNVPICEVYLKCGFNDYSNFFRAFKQEFGLTPKQYLHSIQLQ